MTLREPISQPGSLHLYYLQLQRSFSKATIIHYIGHDQDIQHPPAPTERARVEKGERGNDPYGEGE